MSRLPPAAAHDGRIRPRIAIAWIMLLVTLTGTTTTTNRKGSRAASATAFSLASIFPRKIMEKVGQDASEDNRNSIYSATVLDHNKEQLMKEVTGNYQIYQQSRRLEQQQQQQQQQQQREDIESARVINTGQNVESVHLQLNSVGGGGGGGGTATVARPEEGTMQDRDVPVDDETSSQQEDDGDEKAPKATQGRVYAYVDPVTNQRWVGLNSSRRKFLAFLDYSNFTGVQQDSITVKTLTLPEPGKSPDGATSEAECVVRREWRALWKERRLITDRTELLAVYQSDKQDEGTTTAYHGSVTTGTAKKSKRGGFADLLNLYAQRLVAILSDERHDEQTPPDERHHSSLIRAQQRNRYGQPVDDGTGVQRDHRILIKWLEDHYGVSETQMLQASRFRTLPVPVQLELMTQFLDWFRGHFPYYYDRCDSCGASQKDDLAAAAQPHDGETTGEATQHDNSHADDDDDDDDNATFLGYIYPSDIELKGKASRTELYQCHKCSNFTRFPRFNSAFDIIQSQRGRCGEYSLLLYRFLRALNHDARWVVDWADHVWAEVLIGNGTTQENPKAGTATTNAKGDSIQTPSADRWVHLDPCEAAVDNPLLYESWGKKQTYIVALYAPLRYQAMQVQLKNNKFSFLGSLRNLNENNGANRKAALVEDVTQQYTSDSWEEICKRRDEADEEVEAAIADAIEELQQRLEI